MLAMDLKTYMSPLTPEQREQFAHRCGTTRGHLQNVMYGIRTCAPELAAAIERESVAEVCCETVLPGRRWTRVKDKDWPNKAGRPLLDVATSPTEQEGA